MGDKVFSAMLLEILDSYEKGNFDESKEITNRYLDVISYMREEYPEQEGLENNFKILSKVLDAVNLKADSTKLRKFITEVIFL